MTGTRVRVTMVFDSDWHVGVGFGRRGRVDRAVAVDAHGLPYIPAKTAVGILRDAAEIAAAALDSDGSGVWARWVEAVFGSQPARSSGRPSVPRPAALVSAPLRLPAPLRCFITSIPETRIEGRVLTRADLVAATRVVRAGVKIDPASGTAEHESFRHTEHARAGLSVEADWTLSHPGAVPTWPAQLLLVAAAGIVRTVGGNRRRGAGAVTVALDGLDELAELRARHDSAPVPEPWPLTSGPAVDAPPAVVVEAGGVRVVRHRADLVLTVRRPVIVDAGVWGNVVRSATFVPGSLLLPLLRPALDVPLAELIRAGAVVVTDATVDLGGGRGVAWPRALTRSKDATTDQERFVNRVREHILDPRLRPALDHYLHPEGSVSASVPVSERIHAVIDDDRQRPTTDSGGLFVYHGIAEGTVLRAEVYLPDDVAFDPAALAGEHRIGRSAKDDYGSVQISVTDPGVAETPAVIPAGAEFTVWVGSQTLLRDKRGGYATTAAALADALAAALGVAGAISIAEPTDILDPVTGLVSGRETAQIGVVRREGWQRVWGLPRPSLTGIAAGSTVLCVTDTELPSDRIAAVHAAGIGQRTGEGFGRVLIDATALAAPVAQVETSAATPSGNGVDEGVEPVPDPVLQGAAWRTAITETAVTVAAAHHRDYLAPALTRAQLGDLRVVLDDLDHAHGTAAAHTWLAAIREGDAATAAAWGPRRLAALEELLTTEISEPAHPVWRLLFGSTPTDLPAEPGPRAGLTVVATRVVLTEMLRAATRAEV
ncbi:RAMP superfamily CRISPR-associated protein [Nocardia abscessus]|uniref:RAMP superfamily CRISPR-associated protein n=1 Tax=Nocardia abscessus TaxID=120957 RepID=UPI002458AB1D|nr:RAMP superfamily CRISPR-associated protein [Nocardia abscessus]